MRRLPFVHLLRAALALGALAGLARPAVAGAGAPGPLVAEQHHPRERRDPLFGGTDADGGVDDWYLSNGVVEVVIDDVGPRPTCRSG